MAMVLVNRRTGQTIASAVELATSRADRRRGLLGRVGLDPAAAMIIAPCRAIHTAFMRFPIDVAFVDREGRVMKLVYELPPWRTAWAPRAHAVVETAAGCLRSRELIVGDLFYLTPAAGVPESLSVRAASSSRRMTAARPAWLGS
jgi:uncharacterized protein